MLKFYCSFISRVSHTEDVQSNINPAVIIWNNKIALRGTVSLQTGSESDLAMNEGVSPQFFKNHYKFVIKPIIVGSPLLVKLSPTPPFRKEMSEAKCSL